MSINFPTSLDSLTNPSSGDTLNSPPHATQHADANDAIEALEAKVGINSSAVTTSHDYKLSAVTGSDKALKSGTSTQSVTGLTLVSPVLNVTSDATGDIYYRNSGGALTRLPIGTAGQILDVSVSGIPEWISNPAATDASTTVKGVVEKATTAEISAGTSTGGTGAQLFVGADAVGSPGASKLAQFTAGGLYPAADGSLITNISIATSPDLQYTPNTSLASTYSTVEVPMVALSATSMAGWSYSAGTPAVSNNSGYASLIVGTTPWNTSIGVMGSGSTLDYSPSLGKVIRLKARVKFPASGGNRFGFGLLTTAAGVSAAYTDTTYHQTRFIWDTTTLYAVNSNAVTATTTNVTGSIVNTDWNVYEIVFTPTVDIKFYINGTLVATHTTNLPTTGTWLLAYGGSGGSAIVTGFPVLSIQN